MKEHTESAHKKLKGTPGADALEAAERANMSETSKRDKARVAAISAMGISRVTEEQVTALNHALAMFFFLCRIPFFVLDHWAFRKFIAVLNPAYAARMPHRDALRTTHLVDMYDETVEETAIMLDERPGKRTVGIDGFKDRKRRHVMNIAEMKVGIATYVTTKWFGAKRHTGENYANAVKGVLDDGSNHSASHRPRNRPQHKREGHTKAKVTHTHTHTHTHTFPRRGRRGQHGLDVELKHRHVWLPLAVVPTPLPPRLLRPRRRPAL